MSTFTKVVPGKVVNHGIISGETFPEISVVQTSPAHFPDFAAVTPKGPLQKLNIPLSAFTRRFGETANHYGIYYNPVTFAIAKLKEANQYSIGFKRLTNNYARSRVVWGVSVFENVQIPDYERNDDGSYKTNASGAKIEKASKITGLVCQPGYLTITAKYFSDDETFQAKTKGAALSPLDVSVTKANTYLTAGTKGKFYPFASHISGVGDYYNSMYLSVGHSNSIDWESVERFVQVNGVFPFQMIIGETTAAGRNKDAATQSGATISNFTLFETLDADTKIAYSLRKGLGAYTGANVNRAIELSDSPFEEVETYQQNIDAVCRLIYNAEYVTGKETPPTVEDSTKLVHLIANPIDFKNERGAPYRFVVQPDNVTVTGSYGEATFTQASFGLNSRMRSSGGLNPYLQLDGTYPAAPTSWEASKYGDWVTEVSNQSQPSTYQLWVMSQDLIEAYYEKYLISKNFKDVIRDRTSFLWDIGYRKSITELFFEATGTRKDFLAIGCSTLFGGNNSTDLIYTRSKNLYSKAIQYPESEEYNAPATRISINLWDAFYIDEPTFEKFSLNIDLMVAFARAGGSQDGRITKGKLPDASTNAVLQIAHTPSVGYEDDSPAADNLINGCITVRPYNMTQWKRPALPTVYNITDSVLKDLVNVWYGVIIEKILQDQWIVVCGQTMPALSYLSTVRDNADKQIHNVMGSCLSSWQVETEFREDEPNARSRMFSRVIYWVGKARYMMDAVLEARNEEELETTADDL